jgi:dihydrofolate reductase
MTKLVLELSTSLDGYVAGPDADLENPLGVGGEQLHEWVLPTKAWREAHGLEGGAEGPESDLLSETVQRTGAVVMGRRMFSGGEGPWEDDPRANGWWGDEPPFRQSVFVVTHHAREPLTLGETTFVFLTEGVEAAVEQARAAAGAKDVSLAGGADVAQQALRAGLVDEVRLHVAPVFLGAGVRLFEGLPAGLRLVPTEATASPAVTHLTYRAAN